jgi:hypothetical protein
MSNVSILPQGKSVQAAVSLGFLRAGINDSI